MRIKSLPILSLMLISLAHGQGTAGSNKVELGEEFTIRNGQEVVVRGEKIRVTFRSVTQDSRCPRGVVCAWAGNGEVLIEVARKNKKQVVAMLNTMLDPKEIVYRGFKIRLVGLSPYPKANQPIDPKDYEATLIVTKED
ncbi:MAG: hypothetical protein WAV20_20560 [Blastocatellia bacterium]